MASKKETPKPEPKDGADAIMRPQPKPPYAMPKLIRGSDGLMHTIYVDPQTGQSIDNLKGYTILDGNNYYKVTDEDDANKDGKVDQGEAATQTQESLREGHTTASDVGGNQNKSNYGPSLDHGFIDKPGWLGPAAALAGLVNPALGLGLKAASFGVNAINAGAVADGRKEAGLPANGKQTVKGFMKDNKGQVSNNVKIGNEDYAVGYKALSPDNRTNLTPAEAAKRAAMNGTTPKEQENTTDEKSTNNKSFIEKATGLDKGWLGKALTNIFSGKEPDDDNKEETSTEDTNGPTGTSFMGHPNDPSAAGPNGISYSHPDRGAWNTGMNQDTQDVASRLSGTLGGMDMSSGYRSPATNAAVGGARNSQHIRGNAFDMSTAGMSDDQKQKAVEMGRLSGALGIGNYSSPNAVDSIHFDIGQRPSATAVDENGNPVHPGAIQTVDGTYGMFNETATNADKSPGWFTRGMTEDRFAPTPTARPEFSPEADRNYAGQGVTPADLDPTSHQSVMAGGAKTSVGAQITANAMKQATSPQQASAIKAGGLTPAAMAAMGFTTRTPAQISQISKALAGELSPSSLKAIAAGDPEALGELGNMVAAVENRAASTMFGTLDKALGKTQFNSLMDANMATTDENYAKYASVLDDKVANFYTGVTKPTSYHVTNYFNPEEANPSWAATMEDPTQVGAHLFGSLPEYGPNNAAESGMMAFGRMAGTDFSPGKLSDDRGSVYSGAGTGTTFGGSAGMSGGAGYSPGGMNSPSGSSYGGSSQAGGGMYGGGTNTGTGTSRGGSAGTSGGGGYSPGGMGSPSGSTAGGGSSNGSFGGSNSPRGMGSSNAGGSKSTGSIGGGSSAGNGWGGRSGSV